MYVAVRTVDFKAKTASITNEHTLKEGKKGQEIYRNLKLIDNLKKRKYQVGV